LYGRARTERCKRYLNGDKRTQERRQQKSESSRYELAVGQCAHTSLLPTYGTKTQGIKINSQQHET